MTLIEALSTISDHRRGTGQRYPLWIFLLLVILGTMRGYRRFRGLSRFMQWHQGHLAERLGLRRANLPSCSTICRLLLEIDFDAVAQAFNHWAKQAGLVSAGDSRVMAKA